MGCRLLGGDLAGIIAGSVARDIAGLGVGILTVVADGWNAGLRFVVVVVAKDGGAFERLALGDANEEVVGAEAGVGNEREGDGWEVGTGFARAAAGAHPFGCRMCGNGAIGRRRRCGGLRWVELAGGWLVADALTIALGGLGELEREGPVRVVIVPEQS